MERKISHQTSSKTLLLPPLPCPLPRPSYAENLTAPKSSFFFITLPSPKISFSPGEGLTEDPRTVWASPWRPGQLQNVSLSPLSISILPLLHGSHNIPLLPKDCSLRHCASVIANSALTGCIIISQVPILLPLKGKLPKS